MPPIPSLVEILSIVAAITSILCSWHIVAGRQTRELHQSKEDLASAKANLEKITQQCDEFRRRNKILADVLNAQMKQTALLFRTAEFLGSDLAACSETSARAAIGEARERASAEFTPPVIFNGTLCWPSSLKTRIERLQLTGLPDQPDDFFVANGLNMPARMSACESDSVSTPFSIPSPLSGAAA